MTNDKKIIIGLTATIILIGFWFYLSQEKQRELPVIEGMSQAIGHLGNRDSRTVRLGGVYLLGNIAEDFPKYHWSIMEVLASFVRENSPLAETGEELPSVEPDVQTALTILGRRQYKRDPKIKFLEREKVLDFHHSNLRGADLNRAYFPSANFRQVNLSQADLNLGNFQEADFNQGNFYRANLRFANLKQANLQQANLQQADLSSADLSGADLSGANLKGAELSRTNFTGADLSQADLTDANLRQVNLQGANLTGTRLPNRKSE